MLQRETQMRRDDRTQKKSTDLRYFSSDCCTDSSVNMSTTDIAKCQQVFCPSCPMLLGSHPTQPPDFFHHMVLDGQWHTL